jgi:23S rRNA (cytidine1920-2'-O)/16S rRNA (cytidine1409-2'-O)-methyltransferase
VARATKRPLRAEVARRWPELADVAEELIERGSVYVGGLPRTNPRSVVSDQESIRIETGVRRFRGYEKLEAALDLLGVDPTGATVLDAGAAAGGFTQLLLDRGARRVYAVEVGYGQLLGSLRQDSRVVNLERTNVGELSERLVPDALDGVTLDLGYLPLATGVPQLNVLRFAPEAWLVALVKPVTELGLCELPQEDRAVDDAVDLACRGIAGAGWRIEQTIRSPLTGSRGAVEAFVQARRQTRP